MSETYGIMIDDSALARIAALRKAGSPEFGPQALLRVAVDGGGCSGFQYRIESVSVDEIADDDLVFEDVVVIDRMSAQYLRDSVIRFQNDLMGAMFVIDNPNAESSCGCKASFSIDPARLG